MPKARSAPSKTRRRKRKSPNAVYENWMKHSPATRLSKLVIRHQEYLNNGVLRIRVTIRRPLSKSDKGKGGMLSEFSISRDKEIVDRNWMVSAEESLVRMAMGKQWGEKRSNQYNITGFLPSSIVTGSTLISEGRHLAKGRELVDEIAQIHAAEAPTDDGSVNTETRTLAAIGQRALDWMNQTNTPQFRNSTPGRRVRQLILTAIAPCDTDLEALAAEGVSLTDIAEKASTSVASIKDGITRRKEFDTLCKDHGNSTMNANFMKVNLGPL